MLMCHRALHARLNLPQQCCQSPAIAPMLNPRCMLVFLYRWTPPIAASRSCGMARWTCAWTQLQVGAWLVGALWMLHCAGCRCPQGSPVDARCSLSVARHVLLPRAHGAIVAVLRCAVLFCAALLYGLSLAAVLAPGPAVLSAEQLVNTWSEAEIGRVIREFGEERHWRGIARRCGGGPSVAAVVLLLTACLQGSRRLACLTCKPHSPRT